MNSNSGRQDETLVSSSPEDDESATSFHERLAAILKCEESNAAFAKRAGISQSGLHRIIHGGDPGLRSLMGISKASGASLQWIATGEIETSSDARFECVVLEMDIDDVQRKIATSKDAEEIQNLENAKKSIEHALELGEKYIEFLEVADSDSEDWRQSAREFFEIAKKGGFHDDMEREIGRQNLPFHMTESAAAIQSGSQLALDSSYVMVPRYDVTASAGAGAFADDAHVIDYMAFQRDWVRRALRVDPDHLVLISATGDSMEPTIRPGDLLLIDTSVRRVQDDTIYVIAIGDRLLVKRLQGFFNGAVTVKSDNANYVEQTLRADELSSLHIAGRVRWIGRLI